MPYGRSCRSFRPDPIPEQVLTEVLAAVRRAPTAGNTWALSLVTVDPTEYWEVTLDDAARERFPWPGLLRAPVLVVPVIEPGAYPRRYAEGDKASTGLGSGGWPVPYWWVDAGAAVMTMLDAAVDAGLGALLFGQWHHENAVRARFGIPEGFRCVGTVALGYPDGDDRRSSSARRGRPPLEEIHHRGGW